MLKDIAIKMVLLELLGEELITEKEMEIVLKEYLKETKNTRESVA